MKNLKYLNAVLTVIAVCLVIITCSVIGIIPTANASTTSSTRFATVPVNADGSINVRLQDDQVMKVDLQKCGGNDLYSPYYPYPVKTSIPVTQK